MPKVVLTDLQSLQNEQLAVARINANFQAVQQVIDTLLSRDGAVPNQMIAVVDMNENRVINLAAPVDPNDAARFKEIQDFYALVIQEAERAEAAADAAEGFRDSASNFASAASGSASSASNSAIAASNSADAAALSEQSAEEDANRAEAAADELLVYEMHFFAEGLLLGNEIVYALGVTRPFSFGTDTSGSFAVGNIGATVGVTLDLEKNGTPFGSIVWGVSDEGVITVSSETSFAPGDIFSVTVDGNPDPTLRDVSISLVAQRSL